MLSGGLGAVVWLATKPKLVLAPAASWEFQSADFTVASEPDWVSVPFQTLVTVSPLARTQLTVHLLMAVVFGFFTVIWPWKPPDHGLPATEYVAWHGVGGGGVPPVTPMPVTWPLPPSNTTSEQP